ncbi:MAG: inositol-3-phosphate synthase [Candidatus Parvarchaeota archaeon]|nr:inositol-3-phosphate synthase [Candidatus Jingweiarchaeum tengchongense]MCW1298263.1 inositol-3-phosphate synthase [Candidatus Jingweiarchaeum tengchongense]MCW1300354.1 inositol-3-phosphate synthase [Candidatus Jingweiarchaeum tengchongense]MCW1304801.1 inositol-3-phosphate synthase [Candidatus Jingweiarchaeum tengchongense]MCW1305391.1 inositol-3-phosphate synthase [Candidatus Jingweiarchaeum tengchongense]
MKKIRVGVIGVGNCFSGLIQGIEFYKRNRKTIKIGLMHEKIGNYSIYDIDFVSAFDVAENKIGKKLCDAIYTCPNCVNWVKNVSIGKDVIVKESPLLDGIGIYTASLIKPKKQTKSIKKLREEILEEIRKTKTEILINYLPVGAQKASEFWASIAIESKCGFINCIPVFIASDKAWGTKFKMAHIPVIGDDIKSQIGATIVHRTLTKLCVDRGAKINRTYQINVGGNTDFLTMLERNRLESKKISKTEAVRSLIPSGIEDRNIYVGPSDFIPFLGNTKLAFIRIEGKMFAEIPFNMELRLEVDDKANSAGVAIDAIRYCKIALDHNVGGPLIEPSAWLMKHPPLQMGDEEAKKKTEEWLMNLTMI